MDENEFDYNENEEFIDDENEYSYNTHANSNGNHIKANQNYSSNYCFLMNFRKKPFSSKQDCRVLRHFDRKIKRNSNRILDEKAQDHIFYAKKMLNLGLFQVFNYFEMDKT